VREIRNAFLLARHLLAGVDLVFIDEFGANLAMTPRYGRAKAGRRVRTTRPIHRGRNVTFAGALTKRGLCALQALPGSATTENFTAWVRDHLCPFLHAGQVVLMDNLRSHKGDGVRALIEARGAFLMFVPPYCPDLNPIEECWSKVKNVVRKAAARSEEALLEAVHFAAGLVTPHDALGWIAHAGYEA